jgi:hypothetical protein
MLKMKQNGVQTLSKIPQTSSRMPESRQNRLGVLFFIPIDYRDEYEHLSLGYQITNYPKSLSF